MPSKSLTKNKESQVVAPVVATPILAVAAVVAPAVVAPTVVAPTVVAPAVVVQQAGGVKKSKVSKASKVVEPVVEVVAAPVVAPVVAELAGGAKKTKVAKVSKAVSSVVPKTASKKLAKESVVESVDGHEAETNSTGKIVRSFKVMLPGVETYEGRFTGLTPYQAANKALSKYYRETEQPKKEILFTIRESTRGSKRSTYTYNGKREKLTVPVEYSIKDGRTIVKNFKNRLVKVKKNSVTVDA